MSAAAAPVVEPEAVPLVSYEDFLKEAGEQRHAEWVGGEVIVLSPASLPHQRLAGFLFALLQWFAEEHGSGTVLNAPFQMRLPGVNRGREPDILFVARHREERLRPTFLDGPADLVVEIVSPESALLDRGEKYAEYEAEGVREYWLLDPETGRADLFVLADDGRYERAREDARGVYRSTVLPGLWIDVAWLWQTPLPRLRDVFRAWGGGTEEAAGGEAEP